MQMELGLRKRYQKWLRRRGEPHSRDCRGLEKAEVNKSTAVHWLRATSTPIARNLLALSTAPFGKLAPMAAVDDVDEQPNRQPYDKAHPRDNRQPGHQAPAEQNGNQRKPRHERNPE